MKKGFSVFLLIVATAATVMGFGKPDPVHEDLIDYVDNQIPALIALENHVNNEFAACVSKKYIDDASMAAEINEGLLPATEELLAQANSIVPATKEVASLHQQYVAMVSDQLEAFKLLSHAAETSNASLIKKVNDQLALADSKSREYTANMEALKTAHKVVDEE